MLRRRQAELHFPRQDAWLGRGSWLGLDVVAKLRGLLCSCFFKTSAHVWTAPWDPGGYACAIIVFRRCPPSIEEAKK